jgi:hypothetical protein
MKPCPKCRRALADVASACFCGWVDPATRPEPTARPPEPAVLPSALQRARAQELLRAVGSIGRVRWTRERRIAKWQEVLDNPRAGVHAHRIAREALQILTMPAHHREPGEDDEGGLPA